MNIDREVAMFDFEKKTPFYPCMFSPDQEQELMRERVYPILLSLRHELDLFVWRYLSKSNNGKIFYLCDALGLPQIHLDHNATSGSITLYRQDFPDDQGVTQVLETDNVRYALSRIRKMVKEKSGEYALGHIKGRGHKTINGAIHGILQEWVAQSPTGARSIHPPSFTANTDRELLKMYMGITTVDQMPEAARANLNSQVTLWNQSTAERAALRNTLQQSLVGKFLLFCYMRDENQTTDTNVVMGGVRIGNVAEKYDDICQHGSLSDGVELNIAYTYPFRVYRNFDELSERMRDYVMSRLTLNKMGRSSSHPYTERKALLPTLPYGREIAVFNDGLSLCWSRNRGTSSNMWFLIRDTRED
jgi:hypothetical protein